MEINKKFLFRVLFWGYTSAFLPLALLASILSLFGVVPIGFNGKEIYGFLGALLALLYIPFVGILMGGTNWVILVIGLWIYNNLSRFLVKFGNKTR